MKAAIALILTLLIAGCASSPPPRSQDNTQCQPSYRWNSATNKGEVSWLC